MPAFFRNLAILPPPLILLGFALVRITIVLLLVVEIPPLWSHQGWYFHHGGDQDYYLQYAQSILNRDYQAYAVQIGYPLVLSGLMRLTNSGSFEALLPWVVSLQGLILAPLSVFVVGWCVHLLTRKWRWAYLSAGLWALMPILIWVVLGFHPAEKVVRGPYVPAVAWLQMVPDGITAFLGILAFYMFLLVQKADRLWQVVVLGCLLGGLLSFRLQQAPLVALLLLALWLTNRRYNFSFVIFLLLVSYYPVIGWQLLMRSARNADNWLIPWLPSNVYYGFIEPTTNHVYLNLSPLDPNTLPALLANKLPDWYLLMGGLLAGLAGLWLMRVFAQRLGWAITLLLFLSPPAAIGFLLFSPIFLQSIYRYAIPSLPFLCVLVGVGGDLAWQIVSSRKFNLS